VAVRKQPKDWERRSVMASPLNVTRNDYRKNPKGSTVHTPDYVCQFLYDIIAPVLKPKVILDPAIGKGALTNPWRKQCHVIGVDIECNSRRYADEFVCGKFEDLQRWDRRRPDLVLCNPPFNGARKRKLYSEVFLRKITELFGINIPVVLFAPMGLRLNQKKTSSRWKWARDHGPRITSIVSLPLDVFPDVKFHSEILLFNVPRIQPHYWLGERYMAA
jgi:hypothetical protein